MQVIYCEECKCCEKRPIMVEVPMDSGNRVQNGNYYRCNKYGNVITSFKLRFECCTEGERRRANDNERPDFKGGGD